MRQTGRTSRQLGRVMDFAMANPASVQLYVACTLDLADGCYHRLLAMCQSANVSVHRPKKLVAVLENASRVEFLSAKGKFDPRESAFDMSRGWGISPTVRVDHHVYEERVTWLRRLAEEDGAEVDWDCGLKPWPGEGG